ncbi:hypothetical protein CR513_44954, partial [Mucuna pruriens]
KGVTLALPTPDHVKHLGRYEVHVLGEILPGLMMMDMNMIDAASSGALMDKTPAVARHLISNMTNNTQQFETRGGAITSRVVNKVSTVNNLRLENQLTKLASLLRDSDQSGAYQFRIRATINNQFQNIKHHHSANNSNNKCHHEIDQNFMQTTELCRNVDSLSARYRVAFDEMLTSSQQGPVRPYLGGDDLG